MDTKTRKEIIASIRKQSKQIRGNPENCFVCGKHILITESHHLIPVASIANYLHNHPETYSYPMPTAWLCPNHHAYWHKLEHASKRERFAIFLELGDEGDRIQELWQMKIEILSEFHNVKIPDDI